MDLPEWKRHPQVPFPDFFNGSLLLGCLRLRWLGGGLGRLGGRCGGRLPRLALIALTANVFPEDREQCRAAGMDDFLAKPFSVDQLREMLSTHMATSDSMQP